MALVRCLSAAILLVSPLSSVVLKLTQLLKLRSGELKLSKPMIFTLYALSL